MNSFWEQAELYYLASLMTSDSFFAIKMPIFLPGSVSVITVAVETSMFDCVVMSVTVET